MAANDTAALVVALSAQLSKFEKDLDKAGGIADRKARDIERRFERINPGAGGLLDNFAKSFIASAVGALALDQGLRKVRQSIKEIDDIGDMSERVGLSTDAIQALRHALGQFGGEAEMADRALDKFSDTVAEAALGGGYLAKVFNANGVSLRDSNGKLKDNAILLQDFARLVANAGSAQEKLKLATDAFGRQSGPKMVQTLEELNKRGLPDLIDQATAAGVVLDKALIERAGVLDKEFRKLEERFATTFKRFATDWGGPFILDVFKGLEIAVKSFALSFEHLTSGRVREALGIVNQFEAAKQRMTVGGGNQLTPEDAADIYDRVGIARPKPTASLVVTKLPQTGGQDGFAKELEQIQKRIDVLNVETSTIDLNTAAREQARITVELETAAKNANKEAGYSNTAVTAEQRIKIDELAAAYGRAKAALESANGPLNKFARDARDTSNLLQESAVTGLRSFEDALVDIVTGSATAQEAFKKLADSIIADLARIAIRQAITGPIAGALGGLFGGGGSLFGGGRAGGGTVMPSHAYRVNENTPNSEWFVPNSPGKIVTDAQMARSTGRRGGGGVVVNVYSSPTFSSGMTGTDQAWTEQRLAENNERLKGEITGEIRNGLHHDSNYLG